jgi:hypothetical protein
VIEVEAEGIGDAAQWHDRRDLAIMAGLVRA